MYASFRSSLATIAQFTDAEFELIIAHATSKHLKKRKYLLQEGDVCKHLAWVAKGSLRMFLVDKAHKEHVMGFGFENNFIADRASLGSGEPSLHYIEALEDTDLLLFEVEALHKLLAQIPSLLKVYTTITCELVSSYQLRIHASLAMMDAEEKYMALSRLSSALMDRVPQHMVASFIGMTPATFSRMRRKLTE